MPKPLSFLQIYIKHVCQAVYHCFIAEYEHGKTIPHMANHQQQRHPKSSHLLWNMHVLLECSVQCQIIRMSTDAKHKILNSELETLFEYTNYHFSMRNNHKNITAKYFQTELTEMFYT